MSFPPAKRKRSENAPITHSNVWHNDGSVVLQAENMQFRVHWSLLALNSSFFRDMQALPQPPDQPSIDGCPIVELHDSALDVEHLLAALYNPTFLLQRSLPLPVVAALIRLGRKYDFRNLLDTAVERLTFENPSTLEEYDALLMGGGKYQTTRIVHCPGVLYDMVTLARENNIFSALPCAYYRALRYYPQASLFDGVPRTDDTAVCLSVVDQRRCIIGREKLLVAQAHANYSFGWLHLCDFEGCADPASCDEAQKSVLQRYLDNLKIWAFTPVQTIVNRSTFCEPCTTYLQESMAAGRKRMWEDLPGFFDLPPWAQLNNDL